jgi:hypothetical protein
LEKRENQEAKSELQQFDIEKHDPLWAEILKSEAQQSGDWDSYAQHLMNRYKSTNAPDTLLDYCDFEARRKNWAAVADLAPELMTRLGTADALRIAGMANLYPNRPAECLRILHLHQNLFADVTTLEQLHQISIVAKTKLGDLISATKEAEELSQSVPSMGNLVTLARLQLNTGDLQALAINARRLYERRPGVHSPANAPLAPRTLLRRAGGRLAKKLEVFIHHSFGKKRSHSLQSGCTPASLSMFPAGRKPLKPTRRRTPRGLPDREFRLLLQSGTAKIFRPVQPRGLSGKIRLLPCVISLWMSSFSTRLRCFLGDGMFQFNDARGAGVDIGKAGQASALPKCGPGIRSANCASGASRKESIRDQEAPTLLSNK